MNGIHNVSDRFGGNEAAPKPVEGIDGETSIRDIIKTALRSGFEEQSEETRETAMNWLQLYLDMRFQIANGLEFKREFSPLTDLRKIFPEFNWKYHVCDYTSDYGVRRVIDNDFIWLVEDGFVTADDTTSRERGIRQGPYFWCDAGCPAATKQLFQRTSEVTILPRSMGQISVTRNDIDILLNYGGIPVTRRKEAFGSKVNDAEL